METYNEEKVKILPPQPPSETRRIPPQVLPGTVLVALAAGLLLAWNLRQLVQDPTGPSLQAPVVDSHIAQTDAVPASAPPTPSPQPTPVLVPRQATITGGTHSFQTFNNCGPASLSMALSLLGISATQQELGQQTRPYQNAQGDNDDKSVTLAEIAAQAQKYGFQTYIRPAGTPEVLERAISQGLPVITRTWLKPGEDIGHFRVLKGYNQDTQTFLQDDSLQGKDLTYTYQSFDELWKAFNYEFLVLFPTDKAYLAPVILGELTDERGSWEKALNNAQERLKFQPESVYDGFNASVALYHLGRYEDSIEAFEKVESRLPSRMLWYQLEPLLSYQLTGQDAKVLQKTQTILDNHNLAFSELYQMRGKIFAQQGQTSQSEEAFRLATFYNESGSWKANLPANIVE